MPEQPRPAQNRQPPNRCLLACSQWADPALAPRLAAGYKIAMRITMRHMLILML
jgi:hypothetical protein